MRFSLSPSARHNKQIPARRPTDLTYLTHLTFHAVDGRRLPATILILFGILCVSVWRLWWLTRLEHSQDGHNVYHASRCGGCCAVAPAVGSRSGICRLVSCRRG